MINNDASSATPLPPIARTKRPRLTGALAFVGFVFAMIAMIAGAGLLGVRNGQAEALRQSTADRNAVILDRYEKGVAFFQKRNFALAAANFEEVIRLQPGNDTVRTLLTTAVAAQTVTPTAAPKPTQTPPVTDKKALFALFQASLEDQKWDTAISHAEQLQRVDPSYQTDAIKAGLYQALVERGLAGIRGSDIEPGLYDLDRAAGIQPLDDAVEGERRVAELYQSALTVFGADWEQSIALLNQLPYSYRDVGQRLREANIGAGNALSNSNDYCGAEIRFTTAYSLATSPRVQTMRDDMRTKCQLFPNGGVTGSLTSTTSVNLSGGAGVTGRLIFQTFDATAGYAVLHLYSAASHSLSSLGYGVQPSSQPANGVAVYNGGAAIYGLYSGGTGLVLNQPGLWPSLSPDGTRVAYALLENNEYRIFVAPLNGSSAPVSITKGTWPAWGPSGQIAFQGCTDVCGIHTINPDVPNSLARHTTSAGDVAMQWSPSGQQIIYASNYSGAWEIYELNLNGGTRPLTNFGATSAAPAFSPDGSRIAYESNRDGAWAIYVANSDGSNPLKLADLGPNHTAWSSERIAWVP